MRALIRAVVGTKGSLSRALVVNVTLALVICVALATTILIVEFYDHLRANAVAALRQEAQELAAELDPDDPDLGLDPDSVRFGADFGTFRYTVFNASGLPILGNEVLAPDPASTARRLAETAASQAVLTFANDRQGVVQRRADQGGNLFILVTARSAATGPVQISEILKELREQAHWVLLGVVIILASAILAGRSTLRPLRQVMAQARDVAPGAPERRLSTARLPTELHPLIQDVNSAFDRLEEGFQAQRDFSSNVAHEVRTPLAVMRSGIEAIEDPILRADLIKDLGQLDRIFVQLIDLARAEAAAKSALTDLDLHSIALDLARTASVHALRCGRTLAVTGAETAPARGHAGLLAVALSNLVRNAINHAPNGSEVDIEVCASPPGFRVSDRGAGVPDALKTTIFDRFQRGIGGQGEGAGIGLAIVKSVAEAHGGTVSVTDRLGGGSVFSLMLSGRANT